MRVWICVFDLVMAACLALPGLYFFRSEGRASRFIAGYNMKSERERAAFDEMRLCRDYGRRMMVWGAVFLPAAAVDWFRPGVGNAAASGVFVLLLALHIVDQSRYRKQ